MKIFDYIKAADVDAAIQQGESADANAPANFRFIAGGTTLVDLMKLQVEAPTKLVDITNIGMDKIETLSNGSLKIGALVRNSDLANHPLVKSHYSVLSEAILLGASAQLRNKATTGGNLLQRTRCVYFRDEAYPCNKRVPGSGCPAIEGHHRNMAILGTSDSCIANNPSDMNVALMALEAKIELRKGSETRTVPISEFYKLPGTTPHIESIIAPGELITNALVEAVPNGSHTSYLKLRDRASYEFALASSAIICKMSGDSGNSGGKIDYLRVAMGGIGAIPWRAKVVEEMLQGKRADQTLFEKAADALLKDARPHKENAFKVELAKRCLVASLTTATSAK